MNDAKHDNFIGHRVEVDCVWKTADKRAACLALDARVRERGLKDTGKHHVDFRRKASAKARTLFLVPVTGLEQLCRRLRALTMTCGG
jgi:hypothetical protein